MKDILLGCEAIIEQGLNIISLSLVLWVLKSRQEKNVPVLTPDSFLIVLYLVFSSPQLQTNGNGNQLIVIHFS